MISTINQLVNDLDFLEMDYSEGSKAFPDNTESSASVSAPTLISTGTTDTTDYNSPLVSSAPPNPFSPEPQSKLKLGIVHSHHESIVARLLPYFGGSNTRAAGAEVKLRALASGSIVAYESSDLNDRLAIIRPILAANTGLVDLVKSFKGTNEGTRLLMSQNYSLSSTAPPPRQSLERHSHWLMSPVTICSSISS